VFILLPFFAGAEAPAGGLVGGEATEEVDMVTVPRVWLGVSESGSQCGATLMPQPVESTLAALSLVTVHVLLHDSE
jgi:hypothetical protein